MHSLCPTDRANKLDQWDLVWCGEEMECLKKLVTELGYERVGDLCSIFITEGWRNKFRFSETQKAFSVANSLLLCVCVCVCVSPDGAQIEGLLKYWLTLKLGNSSFWMTVDVATSNGLT